MQRLESDINNPDAALGVLFYTKPIQNTFMTEQEGRPIFSDVDMVRITTPGDDKNIIDTFAREDHKRRFPVQWAHYQNKQEGDQRLAGKTPINQWARITPAMAEELRAIKFLSVEDVASASDSNIQAAGMISGMSPHAFRDAARAYLRLAAGEAAESKTAAELADSRKANAELQAAQKTMADQMAQMQAQLAALAKPADTTDPLAALAGANSAVETPEAAPARRTRGA